MANPKLIVQPRKILGRKVKKLRREGVLPANLYGKKIKSQSLEMNSTDFFKIYKEVGETGLVDLTIGKQVHPVLIHNLQAHPVTSEPLHVDFRQVSLTEKTTATVPIEIRGEAPAVEQKLGILIQPLIEVEVEALPADLPDELVVDVTKLAEVNQTITVADLVYDKKKVELKAELTQVVAKINPLEKEEVVAPPPVEEVPAEGVPEGEVPAEGVPPAGGAGEEKPAEEKPGKPEEKPKEEQK
jgi:large subunit ribosomal protein L25